MIKLDIPLQLPILNNLYTLNLGIQNYLSAVENSTPYANIVGIMKDTTNL